MKLYHEKHFFFDPRRGPNRSGNRRPTAGL